MPGQWACVGGTLLSSNGNKKRRYAARDSLRALASKIGTTNWRENSLNAINERRALLLGLLAVVCWSTAATGFKLGLRLVEPVQLLLLGSLVSTALFWCATLPQRRYRLPLKSVGLAAIVGAMNPCAFYLVLLEAYDRLPAQIAQPLNYTWAITLAILAWPVLGQRLRLRTLAGIVVSYVGVLVLLTEGNLDAPPDIDWLGVALALGSTLIWASYWLLNARVRVDPIGLLAWSFTFGSLFVGALCVLGPGLPPLSTDTALYGLWIGLLEMGAAYLVWQRALRSTAHAGRLGQLIFLAPFLSYGLIATVLGETIRGSSLIGLVIIVAGLMATRAGRQ